MGAEVNQREWVCIDGHLVAPHLAVVSVFDSGFTQGIGLFETMRAYNGVVFRLHEHLERLRTSARALGWSVIPEIDELRESISTVVHAMGSEDGRVRLTVTTGSLRAAVPDAPRLTTVTTAATDGGYPAEMYRKGVTAILSPYEQSGASDPTLGHKTTSYFSRLASLRAAHSQQAFECLWRTPRGDIAEGAISNVFIVRDNVLMTPPLSTPVLPGVTRNTVIQLAQKMRLAVEEQAFDLADLQAADEVFLTNSMMEIMPVVRIGRTPIANERFGDVTHALAEAYAAAVREECRLS